MSKCSIRPWVADTFPSKQLTISRVSWSSTLSSRKTETGGESELAFWRRRVAQSCIYGVDLNPLAVDLAQLSLWLATVAKDRPLSFLDHHLRSGNSLIGDAPRRTQTGDDEKEEQKGPHNARS